MKKIIAFFSVLLFAQQLSAFSFYDQLCNFNFNWKKYELRMPGGEARHFNSDKEYIQAHLSSVLPILRSNPTAQLNAEQYTSRMHLIGLLDGYRKAGNFPMNYYRAKRVPVFIDEHQTHCAVGFLLQQTGHEDMALRIAAADNYAWLKDIHDAELPAWQEASGFTMEELKLIQGAYDSYIPDAFILPNKYEIPQKPACILAYFEDPETHKKMTAKPENIWCKGEGINGVLNGRWTQNFAAGLPWIVGYYENGLRSGQWQEYYQGTKQLCRTENWRNNKLNGVRKRFDQFGHLIEEILFRDGKAITKTNYSLEDSLTWIRKPIDSATVWTEVYNAEGAMIAAGHEKISNPGNLLWFQNIELTALNSISVQARDMNSSSESGIRLGGRHRGYDPIFGRVSLYNSPPLVQYKKEGDWTYYPEYAYGTNHAQLPLRNEISYNYRHMSSDLYNSVALFENIYVRSDYDSIRVEYKDNNPQHFFGYSSNDFTHLYIHYYDATEVPLNYYLYRYGYELQDNPPTIKECGQYNEKHERIGTWKYFSKDRQMNRTENYLIPWKEEEEPLVKH